MRMVRGIVHASIGGRMDANQTCLHRDGRTLFKVSVHVALCLDVFGAARYRTNYWLALLVYLKLWLDKALYSICIPHAASS